MKHITKGNDFQMRIPVVRIYNGERMPMPLPACTDIVVNICSPYRRISLAYTIDVAEDNVILAKVEGDQLYVGKYALEVKGKIGGVDWRSNEYEQIAIVDNNASADTSFNVTEEGEDSLLMDTAVAILAPDTGLYDKVLTAEEAREAAENARVASESERIAKEQERKANEDERKASEASRVENESVRIANEQARTASEAERVKAENIRKQNESERVRNESSRSEAEVAREKAETKRQEAEATRQQAETQRIDNETERKAAETARQQAETSRQAAETVRDNAEKTRQQNESERQTAEQERIENFDKCVEATNTAITAAQEAVTAANKAMETAATAEATIAKSEKAASDAAVAVETANSALSAAEDATAAANNAIQEAAAAEAERANAESERKQAETARANAETVRQQAETSRANAETLRQQKETERQQAETERGNAESERVADENIRTQNETARQEAEQERIKNNENCVIATNSALSAAEKATTAANNAMQVASTAEATIAKSEKAASDAAAAVETANTALSAAEEATTAANNATTDATNAAGEANAAAERANEAADLVYNGDPVTINVTVTSSVPAVSTAGITLKVILDGADEMSVVTDENGQASFQVPAITQYSIIYPRLGGCQDIPQTNGYAGIKTRSYTVDYKPLPEALEQLTIRLYKWTGNHNSEKFAGQTVHLTIAGETTDYITDENGEVFLEIPFGTEYTYSVDEIEGLFLYGNIYSWTYTAGVASRIRVINYRDIEIGLFFVCKDGAEFTYEEFVDSGRDGSDAVLIKIVNYDLASSGNIFGIDIDDIANGSYLQKTYQWCVSNVQFNTIPPSAQSANGLSNTINIVNEAAEKALAAPAATYCLEHILDYGYMSLQGFLPAVLQKYSVVANEKELNTMLAYVRPDATYNFTKFCDTYTWTSDQQSAGGAWGYARSASYYFKNSSLAVLPFCAF